MVEFSIQALRIIGSSERPELGKVYREEVGRQPSSKSYLNFCTLACVIEDAHLGEGESRKEVDEHQVAVVLPILGTGSCKKPAPHLLDLISLTPRSVLEDLSDQAWMGVSSFPSRKSPQLAIRLGCNLDSV